MTRPRLPALSPSPSPARITTALLSKALVFLFLCFSPALQAQTGQTLEPDTMQARVAACTHCHGTDGRAGPDGFYPRIAGKPAAYLYAQLLGFRDGGRSYEPMRHLLEGLSDEYLSEIAQHFADMDLPYARPTPILVSGSQQERGRMLTEAGDAARGIPACIACHGASLSGKEPGIPGLLGLPRDYIAAQLGSWRTGLRHAAPPDCMAEVANQLAPEDIAAVSAWLATRPVEEPYVAAPAESFSLPVECGSVSLTTATPVTERPATQPQVKTGRYLALAANCAGCHTVAGGKRYGGGTAITTRFGTLYGPNITPSQEHGIGKWSADDFWQAMHHGKAPDGSSYYPAFPYSQYTGMTRADTDAIYAYLMSQPAVETPNRPHNLRFPYNQRFLLSAWRAVYFQAGALESDPSQDDIWHRGRYLVEAVGHCAACHTPRNRWAANDLRRNLQGADMLDSHWYATPLTGDSAGLRNWSAEDIAELLRTGVSKHGSAAGPMAGVVSGSTQYLSDSDLTAMSAYLKSLPPGPVNPPVASPPEAVMLTGRKLYEQHCVSCHQAQGEGSTPAWPPLTGNASVLATTPNNVVQVILKGGYAPSTASNPRPHGMPPYHGLSDSDIAALASYIRHSWGNQAGAVSAHQVTPLR